MRRNRSAISLGDLARAVRLLHVQDPATITLVAEMLGFSVEPRGQGETPEPFVLPPDEDELDTQTEEDEDDAEEDSASEARGEGRGDEPQHRAIPIELSRSTGQKEVWAPSLGPPPPPDEGAVVTPPFDPLFMPQWTRGILSAALATRGGDGPLDVEAVAEILARGEHVARLPQLPSWTLGRGVQLLLDRSQAMTPFVRDQAWLLREIRNVIGTDRLKVLPFAGSPARGAGAGTKRRPPYQPPPPGTPVVLLSDLGICQPAVAADWASEDEWVAFAVLVRRAGCPLLALVPYKPSRWPHRLARLVNIIQWDRGTTAAAVANLNRRRAR
ncbi:MAG TPA: hypothetical protein VEY09_16785 [Pyrinomonadaceae bacterium]|nr:hypothetical protein [Pyrinomonadaceae bacterium]